MNNHRPNLLLLLAFGIAMAGCGPSPEKKEQLRQSAFVAEAQTKLTSALIDPASAQFANLRIANVDGRDILCGDVNGRNRFGGYVGFTAFTVVRNADGDIKAALSTKPVSHQQAQPCMPLTDPDAMKDPAAAVGGNWLLLNACTNQFIPDLTFWRSTQELCPATVPYEAKE